MWNESSVLDLDDCLINSTKNYGEICEAEICVKSLSEYQYKSLPIDNQHIENVKTVYIVRYCSYQLHRPDFPLDEKGEAIILEERKSNQSDYLHIIYYYRFINTLISIIHS